MKALPLGPGGGLRLAAEGDSVEKLELPEVKRLLDEQGALFFTGYGATASQFHALARLVVRKPRRTPLERTSHPLHRDLQTVTKGLIPQNFHAEFSHLPRPTEVMAFWCQVPGNATMVVDGVRLFSQLSTETQHTLTTRRLRYTAMHPPEMWHAFLGTDSREDVEAMVRGVPDYRCEWLPNDNLVTHYVRPATWKNAATGLPCLCNNMLPGSYSALWVTFEDGEPLPPSLLDEVTTVAHRECATLQWQPGDFLVVDNTRHMHARTEQPAHRRMYLLQGWR